MDLEEWEFLSKDGLIVDQLGDGKKVISRENLTLHPNNSTIDMNYFEKFIDPPENNLAIPVPEQFESPKSSSLAADDLVVNKKVVFPETPKKGFEETVSPKKKIGENEFADMKLDSLESTEKGFHPQIDDLKEDEDEVVFDCKEKLENGNDGGGMNIWKMGMTGVGALCSFGFACATICVIALGSRHRDNHHHHHFQFYTDDKRIKQVVHHAAKLNEAISAVRGAPVNRAHITIGGYYEGL